MKIKVLSVSAVALLASVTSLWAADCAGKWFARIPYQGAVLFVPQTVFNFRMAGTELLGTVSYPFGEETPISDGKINGDQISFVVIKGRGGQRLVYKGIVVGEEITFTQEIKGEGALQEFVARREFQRNEDTPLRKLPTK